MFAAFANTPRSEADVARAVQIIVDAPTMAEFWKRARDAGLTT